MQKEGGNKGKVKIDKSFFLKVTLATLLFITCSFTQSHCHPSSRVNTNVGVGWTPKVTHGLAFSKVIVLSISYYYCLLIDDGFEL
jgi:hypothetical protein